MIVEFLQKTFDIGLLISEPLNRSMPVLFKFSVVMANFAFLWCWVKRGVVNRCLEALRGNC